MTANVQQITEQIKALGPSEQAELFQWLDDFEEHFESAWDRQIEEDFKSEGRLHPFLQKVKREIAEGRTKPLDEVIGDQ